MSCNTTLALSDIVSKINEHLDYNYIDKDDPRINLGVFTEPTIRGGLVVDEAAKFALCGIVADCDREAPFGKQWVDRPPIEGRVLYSYEAEGSINTKWANLAATGATTDRPSIGLITGQVFFDKTLAAGGKPVWWTGENWVDYTGAIV